MATKKVMKKVTKKAMKLVFEGIKVPTYCLAPYDYSTSEYRIKDLKSKVSKFHYIKALSKVDRYEIIKVVTLKQTKTYYWLIERIFLTGDGSVGTISSIEEKPLYEVELVKKAPGSKNRWIVKRK